MESLRKRLEGAGLPEKRFEFVEQDTKNGKYWTSVKTLIWEVVFVIGKDHEDEEEANVNGPYYFATAICENDRVDEDKLKEQLLLEKEGSRSIASRLLSDEDGSCGGIRINSLTLADTKIAEELTGYMSGTIPPIGHTKPMLLILDLSLLNLCTTGTQDELNNKDNHSKTDKLPALLSLGSGSFRFSLRISLPDVLDYAKILTRGARIASISSSCKSDEESQPPKERNQELASFMPLPPPAQSSSFDDHDNNNNKKKQKQRQGQGQGQGQEGATTGYPPTPSTTQASPKVPTTTSSATTTHCNPLSSLSEEDDIQNLSQVLREACLQRGRSHVIQSVIDQAGERFPELVLHEEICFSRNALHLAAWKSDLESIQLLVEAGEQHGLDLVNAIVSGEGNFGKTAIFYAINSGNDDAVRFFLNHGANLLIRNRPGNTPCESAKGRLESETVKLLREHEREQLRRGGIFKDYTKVEGEDGDGRGEKDDLIFGNKATKRTPEPNSPEERLWLKKLSKRLRDSAGKLGKFEVVRGIIEEAGDRFPHLVKLGTDGNFTKNALHLAAWKGDPESIELLIDAGKRYGLDLVNIISMGEGNYGKTPIFFAITQDRDDVVKLFLEKGANLLIVNNKGQSPCSMSGSHLQPETCQLMYETEYKQIQAGAEFHNYRQSHGDDKQYGDLDPRFEIDPANYGVDIAAGLQKFRDTMEQLGKGQEDEEEGAVKKAVYGMLPLSFQPRSLRPTTKETRQARADQFRLSHSVSAQKVKASKLPPARDVLGNSAQEKKDGSGGEKFAARPPNETGREENDKEDEIMRLPRLHLNDLPLGAASAKDKLHATVIDSESLVSLLAEEVACTLDLLEKGPASSENSRSDNQLVELSWGLDCEWKPSFDRGRESPVATLQLSTSRRSFLVDLQLLCQPEVKDPHAPMSNTERQLSKALSPIFSNVDIPVIGFGIGQDISKLAVSFPHLPCFHDEFHAVVDLDVFFKNSYPKSISKHLNSLRKCAGYVLHKRLDKAEQCSNWQQRPLTPSQIEYASLDAAVLPCLLKEAVANFSANNLANSDGFFSKHPHLLNSWRITFLDAQHIDASISPRTAYGIDHGTSKNLLSLWYSRQTWQTDKDSPATPLLIPLNEQREPRDEKIEKEAKKTERRQQTKAAKKQIKQQNKKKPLKLTTVSVTGSPTPGKFLGYTKENCIVELLSKDVLDSLDNGYYLGFNRRGGIIQMRNAWLLFVNFGGGAQNGKFRNKFSENGRYMTFIVDPTKGLDGLFYDYVSVGQTNNASFEHNILLFIRPAGNSEYLFCGKCKCVGEEARSGNIDVLLEMTSFESLTSSPYMEMVAARPA